MKKDFRKKVIEYRNNKDTDFISTNSQKITEKLLSMNCIKDANTIMLYLDFNNEVNVEDIDILIVPAVAYDKDCYRLGYGGGFYDRFIEHLRDDAITIGIAFDLQVFDSIPKENHDAQLNYVITEK